MDHFEVAVLLLARQKRDRRGCGVRVHVRRDGRPKAVLINPGLVRPRHIESADAVRRDGVLGPRYAAAGWRLPRLQRSAQAALPAPCRV